MKEHGLLFQGAMVCGLLDGIKTQTRRLVTPNNSRIDGVSGKRRKRTALFERLDWANAEPAGPFQDGGMEAFSVPDLDKTSFEHHFVLPLIRAGDGFWAKETHLPRGDGFLYRADFDPVEAAGLGGMYGGWTPSILMPRAACRISGVIPTVRAQRVQEISAADAIAEGIERVRQLGILRSSGWKDYSGRTAGFMDPRHSYATLWDLINTEPGKRWEDNPPVWAYYLEVRP